MNSAGLKLKDNLITIWNLEAISKIEPLPEKLNSVWEINDSNGSYYLKVKQNHTKALDEIRLLNHLKSYGLPVPVPIPTKLGDQVPSFDGIFYCLYPKVQGDVIKGNSEIVKYGTSFGSSLGLLHKALSEYDPLDKLEKMNITSQLDDWIIREIKNNAKELDSKRLFEMITLTEKGIKSIDNLPFQPIHRDPHAEHFFFHNNVLSGLIDFELSIIGPRIFDFCYLSTSIITDYSGNNIDSNCWYYFLSQLISGYRSINPLQENELESVEYMLYMIELIFIAFWCSIGKYENARVTQNALFFIYNNREDIVSTCLKICSNAPLRRAQCIA